jgi:hypothetical protein
VSKNKEIFGRVENYKTGIYNKGLKTHEGIKSLFQPREITIMEGYRWLDHEEVAYGSLIGLFVDPQHLERLKEKEIEVVQGGFIEETNFYEWDSRTKKLPWGTLNDPTSGKLAASFYSRSAHLVFRGSSRVYFYLEYGSNKPALISHLWHGSDLVFGNKENSAFTDRYELGKQILQSTDDHGKTITYTLSIS